MVWSSVDEIIFFEIFLLTGCDAVEWLSLILSSEDTKTKFSFLWSWCELCLHWAPAPGHPSLMPPAQLRYQPHQIWSAEDNKISPSGRATREKKQYLCTVEYYYGHCTVFCNLSCWQCKYVFSQFNNIANICKDELDLEIIVQHRWN